MEQNYTANFLLKYLYRETDLLETLEIENEISENPAVKAEYLKLKKGKRRFPKVKFYPTDNTIKNILSYSSQSAALNASF